MKKIYILFLSCLVLTATSYSQSFSWMNIAGNGSFVDYGLGVAVDNSHNVIATGMHFSTANFGATVVNGFGYQDAYLAKYDSTGALLWVHGIGGGEQDWGYAVAVDASDNIYVTGTYAWYAIHFTPTDSLAISAPTATNTFIAKYDPSGNFLWARSGGCAYSKSSAITTDPTGNVIVSGYYNSTINFSSTVLTGGATNLFFVKYSPTGSVLWAKSGTTSSMCSTNALTCDATGNIYATGKISQNITFGSNTYTRMGGDDMYTSKFDTNGNIQWFQLEGTALNAMTTANLFDCGNGIDVDAAGNVYVAGSILDTFIVSSYYQGLAVVKYNNSGVRQWIYTFGNNSIDVCNSLSLDGSGNLVVIGNYFGALTIGTRVLPSASDVDVFMAKFSPAGACLAAIGIGTGNGNDSGNGIFVDGNSSAIAITGTMRSTLTFGTITVVGDNASTIFVGKMNSDALSGMNETLDASSYSLYPNPSNGILNLQFENAGEYFVEIYNSTGQVVLSKQINEQFNKIDISAVGEGFYSISILDENGNRTIKKIVKQ